MADNEAPLPKTKELVWETELEGTLDEAGYEAMVALLRRELDLDGKLQRIGGTLTWSIEPTQTQPVARWVTVTIESRRGKTRVRVSERLNQLWNQNIIGFTAGLGWIGAIVGGGAVAAASPLLIPIGALAPFGGMYMWAKRRYERISRERRRQLGAVMHDLEELAREHSRTRVRVEDEEAEHEELEEDDAPVIREKEA